MHQIKKTILKEDSEKEILLNELTELAFFSEKILSQILRILLSSSTSNFIEYLKGSKFLLDAVLESNNYYFIGRIIENFTDLLLANGSNRTINMKFLLLTLYQEQLRKLLTTKGLNKK